VFVNEGLGSATHDVVALQFVVGQFEVVVERAILTLKPGTSEVAKMIASRNGRKKQVVSFNSLRYLEQCREHIAAAVNVLSNALEFPVCQFSSA
jgi:hypothetical protein